MSTDTLDKLDAIVASYNARSGKRAVDVDALLVSLLRSCFTAEPGNTLLIADFAQIEARVVCWLAGQDDALTEFVDYDALTGDAKKARDPYRLMASSVFRKPVLDVTPAERFIGKTLVLGAGFGLGAKGFNIYAALNGADLKAAGVTAKQCIDIFRKARPKLVSLWRAVENAVVQVVRREAAEVYVGRCTIRLAPIEPGDESRMALAIRLPSGRTLRYPFAEIEDRVPGFCASLGIPSFTKPTLVYADPKKGRIPSYGGKLVENITQAVASDVLREAKLRLEDSGFSVVIDVHDEVVVESSLWTSAAEIERVLQIVSVVPHWATGLPIKAEGFESRRYTK